MCSKRSEEMLELLFFDRDSGFPKAIKEVLEDKEYVKVAITDVRMIEREGTIFVSPANSFGVLDGGLDEIYSRELFPNAQSQVRTMIEELDTVNEYGKPYLPIGRALLLPTSVAPNETQCGARLLIAPTMYLPGDVRHTNNAYLAMKAILERIRENEEMKGYKRVAIPALCCGCGKMSPEKSAEQIKRAIDDFLLG